MTTLQEIERGNDGQCNGMWMVALQISKHEGNMTAHSIMLCHRPNCSEAEALKSAFESVSELKPGFSIDQWLTFFVPHILAEEQKL